VRNLDDASQIARDWNTKDERSGYIGYVLKFAVETDFRARDPVRQMGDGTHREY
jgi:hypothetical protein